MDKITDEAVYLALYDQDTLSGIAWRDDDPTLEHMLRWIDEHPDDGEEYSHTHRVGEKGHKHH
jgi:hypothetical protein